MPVPAATLNELCLSGLAAVAHAAEVVMLGRHEVVLAGGMESMTGSGSAPRCPAGLRVRWCVGRGCADVWLRRGFHRCSDRAVPSGLGISRAEKNELAARPHPRAAQGRKVGILAEEIVPVAIAAGMARPPWSTTDHDDAAVARQLLRHVDVDCAQPVVGQRQRNPVHTRLQDPGSARGPVTSVEACGHVRSRSPSAAAARSPDSTEALVLGFQR
ncbi:hypothetical protein [Streptomyces sp. NPDC006668]|uniref:thiolase family protein n=1 Tax=Streptomyces sp. NPDC006668 TaxID=3156903 RepID=UPI0033D63F2D